jgi:hypothetical protein
MSTWSMSLFITILLISAHGLSKLMMNAGKRIVLRAQEKDASEMTCGMCTSPVSILRTICSSTLTKIIGSNSLILVQVTIDIISPMTSLKLDLLTTSEN